MQTYLKKWIPGTMLPSKFCKQENKPEKYCNCNSHNPGLDKTYFIDSGTF